MAEEFYSFTEALKHLRLKEEELKRLVSEGEIRAFRDGDTMQLRKQDVENLRSELMGGEVIDLGGAGEDLVFEDDADLGDAGMATEEISEMDTLLEEDVEDVGEIDLEEEEEVVAAVPVRRTTVVAVEEKSEGLGMRAVMMLTTVVLLLVLPIVVSVTAGKASDIAKMIAGIFGKFE